MRRRRHEHGFRIELWLLADAPRRPACEAVTHETALVRRREPGSLLGVPALVATRIATVLPVLAAPAAVPVSTPVLAPLAPGPGVRLFHGDARAKCTEPQGSQPKENAAPGLPLRERVRQVVEEIAHAVLLSGVRRDCSPATYQMRGVECRETGT